MFSCIFLISSAESIKPWDNEQNSTLLLHILSKTCLWEAMLCRSAVPLWVPPTHRLLQSLSTSPKNKTPPLGREHSPLKKFVTERLIKPFLLINRPLQMQKQPSHTNSVHRRHTTPPDHQCTLSPTPALILGTEEIQVKRLIRWLWKCKGWTCEPGSSGLGPHTHTLSPLAGSTWTKQKAFSRHHPESTVPVDISTVSSLEVLTPYPFLSHLRN